ncbi:hypothetical protein HOU02_gp260 [Caulobacter phage CcrBL9]|uniref:Uncharacterized protein n=1 Tax=Caulobacter phage CcrBL9 TaxID=2283270 RepID=A0A385EEL4_9CAUD|nr:hypothetical protein HOU02_gp260 [Caulobacter phage CcrBL9]AXQ69465.1 hypothetical protein CcrBL9_gp441 [Caulobacter phage CcrBL9]
MTEAAEHAFLHAKIKHAILDIDIVGGRVVGLDPIVDNVIKIMEEEVLISNDARRYDLPPTIIRALSKCGFVILGVCKGEHPSIYRIDCTGQKTVSLVWTRYPQESWAVLGASFQVEEDVLSTLATTIAKDWADHMARVKLANDKAAA